MEKDYSVTVYTRCSNLAEMKMTEIAEVKCSYASKQSGRMLSLSRLGGRQLR